MPIFESYDTGFQLRAEFQTPDIEEVRRYLRSIGAKQIGFAKGDHAVETEGWNHDYAKPSKTTAEGT